MRYLSSLLLLLLMFATIISCEKPVEKKPPSAAFSITPGTGSITTTFEFNGNSSSDDTDPVTALKVRWDFDGDGIWDTDFSENKISTQTYEQTGLYTVAMEVINTEGWTDLETHDLNIYADSVAPTAIFSVFPDTASVNTVFHFNAEASSDPYTPTHELEFRWDWQNDSIWDIPYINDTERYFKFTHEGTYRVLMEVKNNVMLTDTTSRLVHVTEY